MSGVQELSTKLDAANHVKMTARRLGAIVVSTINELGDPMIIKVLREGSVVFIKEGTWSDVYRNPQGRIEDLRWRELGLLLDRCDALGFKF